jgi:alpha-mannosidase
MKPIVKTIHLIFQAHLDPVWLWPWQAGLDEALATCRSACDRLDNHPDLIFTRGEAWVYQQIERVDPKLFERIRRHVQSGQWEFVGGWWLQPDCNLPSGWALEKQIALGREYFESRFAQFPVIGYNVDSFGHAATLPQIMHGAGQQHYIMMRPQEKEMALPARLFRWRGYDGGPEVTTFRIASSYNTSEITVEHLQAALTELPDGVEHTMCFVGVGDHGGGPTEAQIAWCREHEYSVPGARLVFSSPSRFFAAITSRIEKLPLVTGELQQHAIGCYSVHRGIKTATRRAEHLLQQAEIIDGAADLKAAWERVCFAHFHDTLGGTCIPSAYPQVLDQLGYAAAVADETLQLGLRRKMSTLPDDTLQRIVAFNASDAAFEDYIEFEPWLEGQDWGEHWQLLDEESTPVPIQRVHSESMICMTESAAAKEWGLPRLLFPAKIAANEMQVWRIARHEYSSPLIPNATLSFDASDLPPISLELIEDNSDTWSHGLRSYSEEVTEYAVWDAPVKVDEGPLMASMIQIGAVGENSLRAEWRKFAGQAFIELRLQIHWIAKHQVLKLVLPLPGAIHQRTDGILGGQLARDNAGRELPLRDWTLFDAVDAQSLGIVCPDVYALDATPQRVRLTLLRSPFLAHHDPHPGYAPRAVVADQGVHEFRFRFFHNRVDTQTLDRHALTLQRPPLPADLTRGMPPIK